MDIYINEEAYAVGWIEKILSDFKSGFYDNEIVGFDLETSPIKGLVGYPGSTVDENGEPIKPDKKTYLLYAQSVWAQHFNPALLSNLGLYMPTKTTSGKEDGVTAGEAWSYFHKLMVELENQSSQLLEQCRWTKEDLKAFLGRLQIEIDNLQSQIAEKVVEIRQLEISGKKGLKSRQSEHKKLSKLLLEKQSEYLKYSRAEEMLDDPLDLRLLTHLVKVPVEGRIKVQSNRNTKDAVQPGLDPYTSTIFLAQFTFVVKKTREHHNFIFNCHRLSTKLILPLLKLDTLFGGANIKFDLKMCLHHLGFAPKKTFCTRVSDRILYLGINTLSHSLDSVAQRFAGVKLAKETRSLFIGKRYDEPTEEMLQYAYSDTDVLPTIYYKMIEKARSVDQEELVRTFSNLSWITALWEYRGYYIDETEWLEIAQQSLGERLDIERQLIEMIDPIYSIKISQGKEVCVRLSKVLKMKIESLAKTNRDNYEREYRRRHQGKTHSFFKLYSDWAEKQKQYTTYGPTFLHYRHPLTGNVHFTFNIAGTDTGRYKSNSPNGLNIPAMFRRAFKAPEGYYLAGNDYVSFEFRIAGDISNDPTIKKMVDAGVDGHSFTAMLMFHIKSAGVKDVTETQVQTQIGSSTVPLTIFQVPGSYTREQRVALAATKHAEEVVKAVPDKITRTKSKAATFTWSFGGTHFGLANKNGLPLEEAEEMMNSLIDIYVVADTYLRSAGQNIHNAKYQVGTKQEKYAYSTGYGGIRRYVKVPNNPHQGEFETRQQYEIAAKEYRRKCSSASRQLSNLLTQGSNAVIIAEALIRMVDIGEQYGITPWLSIYDELIALAPDEVSYETTKEILEDSMLTPARKYMTYLKPEAPAEVDTFGKYWRKS